MDRLFKIQACITSGCTEVAFTELCKSRISSEHIQTWKIDGNVWVLHKLPARAFVGQITQMYTELLIKHFHSMGWDINSVTPVTSAIPNFNPTLLDGTGINKWSHYSLLHLACLYKSRRIIGLLVDLGANINSMTVITEQQSIKLSPLHISVFNMDWPSAYYLIKHGADALIEGLYYRRWWQRFMATGDSALVHCTTNTPIGLVLRDCNKTNEEFGKWIIAWCRGRLRKAEFEEVLRCNRLSFIVDVLENLRLYGRHNISPQDITLAKELNPHNRMTFLFVPLFSCIYAKFRVDIENNIHIFRLIEELEKWNYDFNMYSGTSNSEWSILYLMLHGGTDYLLEIGILSHLMKHSRLNLWVKNRRGCGPVEFALKRWLAASSSRIGGCLPTCPCLCWRDNFLKMLHVLIVNGADVASIVINSKWDYHTGFDEVLKFIFKAGAGIDKEYLEMLSRANLVPEPFTDWSLGGLGGPHNSSDDNSTLVVQNLTQLEEEFTTACNGIHKNDILRDNMFAQVHQILSHEEIEQPHVGLRECELTEGEKQEVVDVIDWIKYNSIETTSGSTVLKYSCPSNQ